MPDGSIEIEVELNSEKAEKELKQLSRTLDTETKKAAKSAETATKQAAKSAETSVKQASKTTEQAAKKAGKTAETAAKQAGEKASQSTKKAGEEQKRSYKQTEAQAKKSAENAEKYWSGAASKIKPAVSTGMKATGAAVIAGGAASLKASISFESAFAGVKKTVNATDKELNIMRKDILNMSKEMPTSANEIAGVAEAAGQLGIKTKNIAGFSKTMVMLGDSTNMSADTAATSLARLANITRMPQTQFGRLGSVIVDLGNNLATTEQEITDMALRLAGAGHQVGMSEADILSFAGALSSVGIEAEAGGTAFSTLMSKMNLATTKGGDELNDFAKVSGMTADQFKKAFKEDAAGAIISFIQGLDKVNKSGGSAIKVLDDMGLSDIRMRDALLRAAGASGTFTEALKIGNNAWNENKALTNEAGQRYKTLESRIKILGNKFTALGIAVGDELKGPLADGVAAASDAIGGLVDQVEAHGLKSIIPKETITTVKNLGSVAKTVAGGGLKVLGASAKFLGENIQTVLPLVTSLLVTFKGYKAITATVATFRTMQTAMTGASTGMTLLGTAVKIFTGHTMAATTATGAFNAACTALGGPIGMVVLAAGALTAGIAAYAIATKGSKKESDDAARSIQNLTQKRKELSKEYQQNEKERKSNISSAKDEANTTQFLFARLKDLNKIQGKTTAQKQEMARIVDELNEKLPDLNLHYDKEKDKLDKTTESIRKQIDAQKDLLLAKAEQKNMESLAEDIVSQEKQVASAKKAVGKATKEQTKAQDELNEAEQKWKDAGGSKLITEYNDYIVARDHLKEKKKLQGEANDELEKEKKKLDELNSKYDKTAKSYNTKMNLPDITKDITEMSKKAKIKGSEIKKSLLEGIASGKYAKPKNGDDLKQLINLDGLMKDAKNAGLKIPEYLKSGISNGSISFKEAVTQLENGLNFQNLYEAAFGKGAEIPRGLAEGIRSGQYAVPTTVNGMKALVQFNDLQTKGLKAGVQIPSKIAEGIASGKIKPSEAVKQMQSLIDFSDAVKKSGKAGDDAVKSLVKSVNNGKTSPKKAMGELAKLMGDVGEKEAGKAGNKTGKKIDDSTAAGVDKNKGKIKTATQGAVDNAKTVDTSGFNSLGSSIASGIAAGIGGNAGVVAAAAVSVVNQALAEAKSKKGADVNSPSKKFRDKLGTAIPEGLAKGIYKGSGAVTKASVAMTQATLNAARKDLGIHSPSLVFNKAIGKYIPLGMALGIEKNAGKAAKAAMKVINVTIGAAKKGIPSPGKMFKILKGETIPKGIAKGVREGQSELVAEMQGVISTALSAAKNATYKGNYSEIGSDLLSGLSDSLSIAKQRSSETVQEIIDQAYNKQVKASEKAEAKLQKKIDKLGNKKKNKKKKAKLKEELKDLKAANAKKEKQLKEAGEKAANAYNTAFEKEADRLTKIAEEKIQELSEKYQEQYNEIKSLQDNLTSKQQAYGSLYDLDQNLYDIEDYQKRLKSLENKIPDSMMQRILGMDVEEGRQYMAWFQSLTAAEQKAYTDKWNKQQSMAESFSESFFKDDFEKINKEYQAAIKKETDNLNAEMKKAGANVAKGLAAGITGETRNLSKAMKKLCKDIVNAAKKELKIKSPSRVFAQIGKFTIQGAEKGQEKEAPRLYRQVETVADTMAARFAKAKLNIPELQSRMQTAVSRQMGKITASVQPQVVYAGGGGTTTIEKTVYTGPEKIEVVTNIEGREAARTLAPFMDSRLNSMADRKARGGV
ncbi:phage tail tape measure protein [Anaerostipes caccae]|uniref:phage tail tape measure protein n=2 Tax=Anaerostipes caccae TaxID=105841 RepID=UPI001CD1DCEF|nr:phage tail tape measure protein [Anaerostipes caccae]UBS43499.1 phage tail tape measure protein [Anaerostipes caccae]